MSFATIFTRLGFTEPARERIEQQGYTTLAMLGDLSDEQIDKMVANLIRQPQADRTIEYPSKAVENLKVLCFWVRENARTGVATLAANYTVDMKEVSEENRSIYLETIAILRGRTLLKPEPFTDPTKWDKWWDRWSTYMSQLRGSAMCPLTYVFRPEVPAPDAEADDITHDDWLVRNTLLRGRHFVIDNGMVYDELKSLVQDGTLWPFISAYDKSRNGRAAVAALRMQLEGEPNRNLRKSKAYLMIAQAEYKGETRNYTFMQYITAHQDAHNILAGLNEAVPESKKVNDFLARISAPNMEAAKAVIFSNHAYLASFTETQTYLAHFVQTQDTHARIARNVSAAVTPGPGGKRSGGNGPGNKRKQATGPDGLKIHGYSSKEWQALSPGTKAKIFNARKQQKNDNAHERTVSSASSQVTDVTAAATAAVPPPSVPWAPSLPVPPMPPGWAPPNAPAPVWGAALPPHPTHPNWNNFARQKGPDGAGGAGGTGGH